MASDARNSTANAKSIPFYAINHVKLILGTPAQSLEAASHLSPLTLHNTAFITTGSLIGLLTGTYLSAAKRSTQFQAENMHRMPTTKDGMHAYHSAKNRTLIEYGIGGGLRVASKFALLFTGFALVESLVEAGIGEETFVASGVAGGVVGVSASVAGRMSRRNALYATAFGLSAGLALGLVNSAYGLVYGTSLRYPLIKKRQIAYFE